MEDLMALLPGENNFILSIHTIPSFLLSLIFFLRHYKLLYVYNDILRCKYEITTHIYTFTISFCLLAFTPVLYVCIDGRRSLSHLPLMESIPFSLCLVRNHHLVTTKPSVLLPFSFSFSRHTCMCLSPSRL
jgi:hypothetical protein